MSLLWAQTQSKTTEENRDEGKAVSLKGGERAQAYVATNLLLEVCLSTKLFGHLHGKKSPFNQRGDHLTVVILHEPMYDCCTRWKVI